MAFTERQALAIRDRLRTHGATAGLINTGTLTTPVYGVRFDHPTLGRGYLGYQEDLDAARHRKAVPRDS